MHRNNLLPVNLMNFKGSTGRGLSGAKRSGHYCPPMLKDRLLISRLGSLSQVPIKSVNGIDGAATWTDHWMFGKEDQAVAAHTPPCPLLLTAFTSSLLLCVLPHRLSFRRSAPQQVFPITCPLLSSPLLCSPLLCGLLHHHLLVVFCWTRRSGTRRRWRHWSSVM